jgi:hypothetical protein
LPRYCTHAFATWPSTGPDAIEDQIERRIAGGGPDRLEFAVGQGDPVIQHQFENRGAGEKHREILGVPILPLRVIPSEKKKLFGETEPMIGHVETSSICPITSVLTTMNCVSSRFQHKEGGN